MARLIIGHTTSNSVRIWVRGAERYPVAFVTVNGPNLLEAKTESIQLEERHGYTGVVEFKGLKNNEKYHCEVKFGVTLADDPDHHVDFGHCTGSFRTFPDEKTETTTTFLLVSCNLHTFGWFNSPDPAYQRLINITKKENVDFMIHCGDQIYYDVDLTPNTPPDVNDYREKYIDAWGDSRPTRKLLTMLPHYMMLDDHEMVNNFSNDMDSSRYGAEPWEIRAKSLKVYREFQHIHNPYIEEYGRQALYYNFSHSNVRFFALDTRTERYSGMRLSQTRIIQGTQMEYLKKWLKADENKAKVKFIISSVPFVGKVINDNNDKWCSEVFKEQREEIIEFLLDEEISGVTFLTGDMHCSYHATLKVTDANAGKEITVNELMSSPVNQYDKVSFGNFISGDEQTTRNKKFKYISTIEEGEFYSEHSNSMLIKVDDRDVTYEIFRTKKDRRNERSGTFNV